MITCEGHTATQKAAALIITLVCLLTCAAIALTGCSSQPQASPGSTSEQTQAPDAEQQQEDASQKESPPGENETDETSQTNENKTNESSASKNEASEDNSKSESSDEQDSSTSKSEKSSSNTSASGSKKKNSSAKSDKSSSSGSPSSASAEGKTWVEPVYKTVKHPEEGHYETVKKKVVRCNCGEEFETAAAWKAHQNAFLAEMRKTDPNYTCTGTHASRYKTTTTKVYVVDKEAWTEKVLVKEGYWK